MNGVFFFVGTLDAAVCTRTQLIWRNALRSTHTYRLLCMPVYTTDLHCEHVDIATVVRTSTRPKTPPPNKKTPSRHLRLPDLFLFLAQLLKRRDDHFVSAASLGQLLHDSDRKARETHAMYEQDFRCQFPCTGAPSRTSTYHTSAHSAEVALFLSLYWVEPDGSWLHSCGSVCEA